jgi:diguanylate cyclase (GGDEF)-like protein
MRIVRAHGRVARVLALVLLACALVFPAALAVWTTEHSNRKEAVFSRQGLAYSAWVEARNALTEEQAVSRQYSVSPSPGLRAQFATQAGVVRRLLGMLRAPAATGVGVGDVTAASQAHELFVQATLVMFSLIDDGGHDAGFVILGTRVQPAFAKASGAMTHAVNLLATEASQSLKELKDVQGSARTAALVAFGAGVVLLAGCGALITAYQHRLERQSAATRHQALHDALTGLPNRTLLLDRTDQAIRSAARAQSPVALMLIDLDRFKEVNDTLGHHHGDVLLQQVAERLRGALRDSDTVARLGGDEFAILLPHLPSAEDTAEVARKLGCALEEPFTVEGLTLDVDASIGVAAYPLHGTDADTLLQRADVAMYAAKEAHAGHVMYDLRLDRNTTQRLNLLGQLRRAVANGELVLHYQPKAYSGTGKVHGVEALVRWQHPELGLIFPDQFIPLAESTGLIRPLSTYVLEAAVRQCRTWRDAGHDLSVAVNISARCLLDVSLPDEVAKLLHTWDVAAGRLVLEITESTIMADPALALDILTRLHELGVQLAIDDFGTGYSSMAYLKSLPVHELKVDRSFVMHMRTNSSDRVIVRSTVDLGHNLGLQVVAEGVEDQETWQELAALGCDTVQGYYLGKPMPAGELTDWLANPALQGTM